MPSHQQRFGRLHDLIAALKLKCPALRALAAATRAPDLPVWMQVLCACLVYARVHAQIRLARAPARTRCTPARGHDLRHTSFCTQPPAVAQWSSVGSTAPSPWPTRQPSRPAASAAPTAPPSSAVPTAPPTVAPSSQTQMAPLAGGGGGVQDDAVARADGVHPQGSPAPARGQKLGCGPWLTGPTGVGAKSLTSFNHGPNRCPAAPFYFPAASQFTCLAKQLSNPRPEICHAQN